MTATVLDMNARINDGMTDIYATVDKFAEALEKAKGAEEAARLNRVAIEEKIIDLLGVRDEGSFSANTGRYKVTTTGKISRKVDWEQYYASVECCIPENMRPVRLKPELDLEGLRYLQNNDPDVYRIMASCITVTPGKPAVTIKEIKECQYHYQASSRASNPRHRAWLLWASTE
jgi:hypothetical protein